MIGLKYTVISRPGLFLLNFLATIQPVHKNKFPFYSGGGQSIAGARDEKAQKIGILNRVVEVLAKLALKENTTLHRPFTSREEINSAYRRPLFLSTCADSSTDKIKK